MIAKDPALCQAMADATSEAIAWTLTNSDEATSIFLKTFPEMALTPDAQQYLKMGKDLNEYAMVSPESKSHGIGYGAPAKLDSMADLVVKYVASADAKKPPIDTFYDPRFAGKVKLNAAQWRTVETRTGPYKKYFG
jgi:ABC-type nitrate/sulfonate/bicarbonate transport system substrate-binding protein